MNATISENDDDLPAEIDFQRWYARQVLSTKGETPEGHRRPNKINNAHARPGGFALRRHDAL
ncbi:MAG TPA: hypothetical protein VLJ17_03100 [Xanthobacteraceae bacterium]|jgi:hypothetical protein|nr:hypothetical protein [Xanthobacteraceae bacterium]